MKYFTSCTNRKNSHRYRAEEIFYQVGKIFWLPFCVVGFWFARGGYGKYGGDMSCAIRRMCGFPCPGCGGTRAFYYLFQGNISESFRQNPIVLFGISAYVHFMLLYCWRSRRSARQEGKGHFQGIHVEYYAYAAIFVLLSQWLVKLANILVLLVERA
ncbi:hypothetical protein IMSAGC019_01859 [Lachnospiraceae bacterium]|nr:hypothetical protein IMSAGC019_01859 [Lachnospiraceae bacterium]